MVAFEVKIQKAITEADSILSKMPATLPVYLFIEYNSIQFSSWVLTQFICLYRYLYRLYQEQRPWQTKLNVVLQIVTSTFQLKEQNMLI